MLYKNANDFQISGATRVYALLGDPVAHSLSPVFWNAAFRHSGIDAIYIPLRVEEAKASLAFSGLAAMHVAGINVTRPLKRKAAEYCSLLHEPAHSTGVVNTIRFGNGSGEGWNTDVTGLHRILSRQLQPDSRATVMGNGASAQTALWALKSTGITRVFQIARSFANQPCNTDKHFETNFAAAGIQVDRLAWSEKNFSYALGESDIIINTTPLGWTPEDFVPELDRYLEKNQIFVDFNYAPESKLVASARKRGCVVIDGRELLFEQGVESFKLLTGSEAPAEVIRQCIYS